MSAIIEYEYAFYCILYLPASVYIITPSQQILQALPFITLYTYHLCRIARLHTTYVHM